MPMKSAYEVASDLAFHCDHTEYSKDICFECVEKGITEFAEERVKEIIDGYNDTLALKEARNAALDEAAKVAEARCQCPHHISIAYEIRALKKS